MNKVLGTIKKRPTFGASVPSETCGPCCLSYMLTPLPLRRRKR